MVNIALRANRSTKACHETKDRMQSCNDYRRSRGSTQYREAGHHNTVFTGIKGGVVAILKTNGNR